MCAAVNVDTVPAAPPMAQHDSSVLDLAFAMDCTSSMGSYICQAQQNIRNIVEEIVSKEKSDVHLALVEYRDHPPQDSTFVTRVLDFTPSVSKMKKRLEECKAHGGGDTPEAVADALQEVLKLDWREEATKICVFISDAPPHGLSQGGDGFPNGCPDGIDPMQVIRKLAEKNVTIYLVGCEPSIVPYRDFFMAMAHITGGQYVPLASASLLSKVIIGGAQEELSLQKLMAEVNEEVQQMAAKGEVDEEVMTRKIHRKMVARKGVRSRQLQMNSSALPEASLQAQKYAKISNMGEMQKAWKEEQPQMMAQMSAGSMMMSASRGGMPRRMQSASRKSASIPAPSFGAMASATSGEDEYTVAELPGLQMQQAQRMVSKAMWKNQLKK